MKNLKTKLKLIFAILKSNPNNFIFLKIDSKNQKSFIDNKNAKIEAFYFGLDNRVVKKIIERIAKSKEN